jgi:drug/metabolite transporter (DMT)-like permease
MAPSRTSIIAGYATIYLVWGSTFLAIALTLQDVPPFLMVGMRFLLAGAIVIAIARIRGRPLPDATHWNQAMVVGGLMAAGGNGLITYGMTQITSGVTALVVGLVPIWIVVVDSIVRRRVPRKRVITGLAVGAIGAGLLVNADGTGIDGGAHPWMTALIIVGTLFWAIGSIRSRSDGGHPSLMMRTGAQMFAGGLILLVLGALIGEKVTLGQIGLTAWIAFAYLILVGSVLAYTTYVWLLRNQPAASVGTYAFVNPLIAVILGVLFLNEAFTPRTVLAGALILVAVVILNLAGRTSSPALSAAPPVPLRGRDSGP